MRGLVGLVIGCLWAAPVVAQTAPTLEQANGTAEAASDTTVAHTLTSDVVSGSVLVCGAVWSGAATTVSSWADDQGNTWNTLPVTSSPLNMATFAFAVRYAQNVAGGATTVTVTLSANASNKGLACAEYSGVPTSSVVDTDVGQVQNAPGTGADAVTSGTSANATSQANDQIVVFGVVQGGSINWTAGDGYVLRLSPSELDDSGGFWEMHIEDKTQVSTAQFAGTFTVTSASLRTGVIAVAIKGAGSATATVKKLLLLGVGE